VVVRRGVKRAGCPTLFKVCGSLPESFAAEPA